MFINSLKSSNEFLNTPSWSLPVDYRWDNYTAAWETGQLATTIRNSVVATLPSLFFIIVLGVAAGFTLEVMVWKGRNTVLLTILAGIMVPGQMILLPLFTIYFELHLTGSLWPLIITYTGHGLPLTVFMMATYFRAIPREIFEASTIDGAGMIRSFRSIGFPMVRNAVLTVALVQFFLIWNDLLFAITFANRRDLNTIQAGLLNFSGQYGSLDYGPLFAAICITIGGILVLYLALNQRIIQGLAAGAVKG
ncbi:carbohydrate ABC transporter permease [Jiangella aurantiaca]|uniref:Carbohydrate ABC transporter permease n=2 Tax=Jiangella aurantiaca TaxID=2530373 RepID=A0A4R5AJV2_9ACTN|nr:carbohydrate ABC transporter permease [Jiangella aurantiaca]